MTRVTIGQPCLVRYRVPVFRELARRPGFAVEILYGELAQFPNVSPEGFQGKKSNLRLLPGGAIWHLAHLSAATRTGCDVLILPWDVHYILLIPALLRARAAGVRTVLWGHGYSKHDNVVRTACRAIPVRLADALLFYNHSAASHFVESFPSAAGRVFVALNALDQTPVQEARTYWLSHPDELASFRRQWDLSHPVVLYVSRLEPDNHVELLLTASARLSGNYPALRVVIVGSGPSLGALRALVRNLGLERNVLFTGAIYDEMSLAPWFLCSDVFCYPENIGLSILHAFGYGLPVVTSDKLEIHGPEIEALTNGQSGVLYRHGNVDSLASVLDRLFSDREYLSSLSRVAHDTATRRFTLDNMVNGIEEAVRFCTQLNRHAQRKHRAPMLRRG